MKNLRFLLGCSIFALLPCVVNAAGTYYNYNGTIQRNYGGPYAGYNTSAGCPNNGCYGNANYNNAQNTYTNNANNNAKNTARNESKTKANTQKRDATDRKGFSLDAGLSHQFASWDFGMATAGSNLHYDNLRWNVFDANLTYDFNMGQTPVRLTVGGLYGLQFGESPMVDDDITEGGYWVYDWPVDLNNDNSVDQIWTQQGQALSVGTSSDGDMMGLHAGLGLVDVWRIGGVRITPSVGYRYFKYKLQTEHNYGMSLDTSTGVSGYCRTVGDETQCLPFMAFIYQDSNGKYQIALGAVTDVDLDGDGYADTTISVPGGAEFVDTENTYYYRQNGVSHSYEVEWMGPYLALDMVYDISADDSMNARLEFGLPIYNATADQPYRPDWQHPTSLEDKGSFGDAYHIGLGANWLHSLSDSVVLTIGMTFDYYNVDKATATSYLNPEYYTALYYDPAVAIVDGLENHYGNTNYQSWDEDDRDAYIESWNTIAAIESLQANGWKQETKDEIESIYKSLGIRIGLQIKF